MTNLPDPESAEGKELARILFSNEKVLSSLYFVPKVLFSKKPGRPNYLIATDRRVIIIEPGLFGSNPVSSHYAYDQLANVEIQDWDLGVLGSHCIVLTTRGKEVYESSWHKVGGGRLLGERMVERFEKKEVDRSTRTFYYHPSDKTAAQYVVEVINQQRTLALTPRPPTAPLSIPEQIKQLAALQDAGILTQEEFETKKADLLSRM